MNITGFLRWQFQGWHKSLTLWYLVLAVLAFVAMATGCPQPWPGIMLITAAMMAVIDISISWFRFAYGVYQLQQDQLIRKLKSKETSHGNS
jgi:hypothetical protein